MLQFGISLYLSENNPFYFLPPINIKILPLFIMLVQKVDIGADQKAKKYQAACIFGNLSVIEKFDSSSHIGRELNMKKWHICQNCVTHFTLRKNFIC